MRGFLLRFLASKDEIDQHIAVWTFNSTPRIKWYYPLIQLHLIPRPSNPEINSSNPTIPRLATKQSFVKQQSPTKSVDDSDFEDESGDENLEEGNEVVNLARSALVSLKKLPTLEELEKINIREAGGSSKTVGVQEQDLSESTGNV